LKNEDKAYAPEFAHSQSVLFQWINEVLAMKEDEYIDVINALLLIGPNIVVEETCKERDLDLEIRIGEDGIARIFKHEKNNLQPQQLSSNVKIIPVYKQTTKY